MTKKPLKIISSKMLGANQKIGIVKSSDWWENVEILPHAIVLPKDCVVGQWIEYPNPTDENNPYREGFTTIAICRELKDAELIINSRIEKS